MPIISSWYFASANMYTLASIVLGDHFVDPRTQLL